ncbi:MAG: tRNA lysidine(34) synthetase TilS [Tepidisphaeraceae bacterium]|jgi:tRNA(Ile)-lysidine synthase
MHCLADLPSAPYALAISGHADSTALLRLMLLQRPDCRLHLVHLDHELRGPESTADADLIAGLAAQFQLPLSSTRLSQLETRVPELPANPSARYRALRHDLFRRVISAHNLAGVLLAHHADDQAETVLQRILRSSSATGLAGMNFLTALPGLRLYRPLLGTRKSELLAFLRHLGQPWREDVSNASDCYQRNRVRQFLAQRPELITPLLELAGVAGELREWTRDDAPDLPARFPTRRLAELPRILACESARRWLVGQGAPPEHLTPEVLGRLVNQATDAASPPRQHFPGALLVGRRQEHMLLIRIH